MDRAALLKAAQAVIPPDERLVLPAFVSDDERRILLAWALASMPYLRSNGEHRLVNPVQALPTIDPLYHVVRLRMQRRMGLADDRVPEPGATWYVSIITAGGQVHPHIDSAPDGMRLLRCNLFLQVPERGGRPIIVKVPIDVTPGTLLAFYPSVRRHASEVVPGPEERVVLSFGYFVSAEYRLPTQ